MIRLIRWMFGACNHRFGQWSEPLPDAPKVDQQYVSTPTDDDQSRWIHESFQRRTCEKCGMIDQRTIGGTVLRDYTDADKTMPGM